MQAIYSIFVGKKSQNCNRIVDRVSIELIIHELLGEPRDVHSCGGSSRDGSACAPPRNRGTGLLGNF